ncbi:MAG TPA: (Fe-S)-binding protein [Chloroflexota bacterium]|nr:(Fe-S)-binding protein [Chloroflexota bacterium]
MDELKDFLFTMLSCNHCGQCKWILGPKMRGWDFAEVCPIHQRYHWDAYSGQGLVNIAQEVLEGTLAWDSGLLELIYSCTTCGACDINCKSVRDMEPLDTILALRAKCVADGQGPMPEHRAQADNLTREGNIYGRPRSERGAWLEWEGAGQPGLTTTNDAEVAFFVGCGTAFNYPQTARDIARILQAGGVEFQVLGADELCCGAPLWRTGQVDAFAKSVARNLQAFRARGIKTLVTGCAECYGTFRGGYSRLDPMDDIEVLHITQVIARLLEEGRLNLKASPKTDPDLKVTYHDPCLLARLSEKYVPWHGEIEAYGRHVPPKAWRRGTDGVYEAPRTVLQAIPGVELVEMVRSEECGYCCGAGGGVSLSNPELAEWIAGERLREARASGAEAIVSCCPFCRDNLTRDGGLPYYELTELVARALAGGRPARPPAAGLQAAMGTVQPTGPAQAPEAARGDR